MMMTRLISAHEPALSPQEAAMLPAMTMIGSGRFLQPRNEATFIPVTAAVDSTAAAEPARSTLMPRSSLMMPSDPSTFCPVAASAGEGTVLASATGTMGMEQYAQRGSIAGRSVLSSAGIALPGVSPMRSQNRGRRNRRSRPSTSVEYYEYL